MTQTDHIRQQIQLFYDGKLEPRQIAALASALRDMPQRPADLEIDFKVISATAAASHAPVSLPKDFEARMERAIDQADAQEKDSHRKRTRSIRIFFSAAASVAAILIAAVLFWNPTVPLSDLSLQPGIAAITTPPDTAGNHQPLPPQPDDHSGKSSTVHKENPIGTQASSAPASMKIVTDPDEAIRYTHLALSTLSTSIDKARSACDQSAKTLNDIDNKIKTIIK